MGVGIVDFLFEGSVYELEKVEPLGVGKDDTVGEGGGGMKKLEC